MSTTITVSTNAELLNAFETLSQGAGGTILLQGSEVFSLDRTMWQAEGNAAVTITSLDTDAPATMSHVRLVGRSNVTIDSVIIDPTLASQPVQFGVNVSSVDGFSILNSQVTGGATGPFYGETESPFGADLIQIRSSRNIEIDGNLLEAGFQGVHLFEVNDISITDNTMRHMQGDGIRIAGVQDLRIEGNFMHDFYGAPWDTNHGDYIQFWGAGIPQNNERIEIRDNILQAGEGTQYQMIFGRNEDFHITGEHFKDFVIEGNVISGSHWHMMSLGHIENLTVRHNTLVWDRSTAVVTDAGIVPSSGANGWLAHDDSLNVVIENNIAGIYRGEVGDNATVLYGDPRDPGHYTNHFVNLDDAGAANFANIVMRPDSPWNGIYGAPMTWTTEDSGPAGPVAMFRVEPSNTSVVTLDASLSRTADGRIAPDGTEFRWLFEDGAVLTGRSVAVDFAEPGTHRFTLMMHAGDGDWQGVGHAVQIRDPALISVTISEAGVSDASGQGTRLFIHGAPDPAAVIEDGRFLLNGSSRIETGRDGHLYNLPSFAMGFDIELVPGSWGQMFMLHGSMGLRLDSGGALIFDLDTVDGPFQARSEAGVLDGGTHRVAISYDSAAGRMHILVDGAVVAEAEATGQTRPAQFWQPTWGHAWGQKTVEGWISDIAMSSEPLVQGAGATTPDHVIGTPLPNDPTAPDASESDILEPESPGPESPEPESPEPETPDPVEEDHGALPVEPVMPLLDGFTLDPVTQQAQLRFLDDAHVTLAEDGYSIHLDGDRDAVVIGRLREFEASQRLGYSVEFTRGMGEGSDGMLVWHNNWMGLQIGEGSMAVLVGWGRGQRSFTIEDPGLAAGDRGRVTVLADAQQDRLQVIVNDRVVLDETDTDISFARPGGRDAGWSLGTSSGDWFAGEVHDFRVSDRFEFLDHFAVDSPFG